MILDPLNFSELLSNLLSLKIMCNDLEGRKQNQIWFNPMYSKAQFIFSLTHRSCQSGGVLIIVTGFLSQPMLQGIENIVDMFVLCSYCRGCFYSSVYFGFCKKSNVYLYMSLNIGFLFYFADLFVVLWQNPVEFVTMILIQSEIRNDDIASIV